jgi:hypothetical protein
MNSRYQVGRGGERSRFTRAPSVSGMVRIAGDEPDRRTGVALLEPVADGDGENEPVDTQWPETDLDCTQALSRGLAGYLAAVATAVAVPVEGTSYEVSDTATAYLALVGRLPDRPGRDLMLVWSEHAGWTVSVETQPTEPPVVLARLGGDPLPAPRSVARFVADALAGRAGDSFPPLRHSRSVLAARLSTYVAVFLV